MDDDTVIGGQRITAVGVEGTAVFRESCSVVELYSVMYFLNSYSLTFNNSLTHA